MGAAAFMQYAIYPGKQCQKGGVIVYIVLFFILLPFMVLSDCIKKNKQFSAVPVNAGAVLLCFIAAGAGMI